jgi:hypothetical protein
LASLPAAAFAGGAGGGVVLGFWMTDAVEGGGAVLDEAFALSTAFDAAGALERSALPDALAVAGWRSAALGFAFAALVRFTRVARV